MGENKRFRFLKRFLSFALVIMLIFTMIPIDKVYAADAGIGTDGNAVDLSLWNYTANGDTYSLYEYKGSIVDGKIVGCVPTNINGKPVTVMTRTFTTCQSLTQAPELPNGVIELNNTFVNCIGLTQAPEIPNSVKIMSGTFMSCTGLTQAPIIPDNVTNISGAFNRCTGLTKVSKIPNSVTKMFMAFFGCTGLTEAPEIPNNVTDIRMTFSGCTGITKAPLIPSSVTDMTSTFYGCTNLTGNVFVPEKVTALTDVFSDTSKPITMIYSSNNTVAASYVAPANVTKVVDSLSPQISSVTIVNTSNVTINAIDNYQSLSYAITNTDTAPTSGWQSSNVFSITSDGIYYAWAIDGVGKISASKAFAYPKALDTDGNIVDMSLWTYTANGDTYSLNGYKGSILDGKIVGSVPAVINDKPVTAMSNTFKGCTVLTQAPKLPNSVLNMSGTFEGCTGLTQATEIPSSVTNMEYAFSGCKALTQVPQLPAGVTNMRYTFNNCTALTQAPVLPSTVTTINHTFSGCTALTQTPEIPAGVTDMNAAFSKCTKLTQTPKTPDSAIDMSYAFYMCTGLTSVPVIPYGIKNMSYTFYGCTKLTGDIFIPNSVTKMSYVFTNTAMPITMIYSSNNTVAASAVVPANVTKAVDSALPEISNVTKVDGTITIYATDDYSVEMYALTTSSSVPTTGWQSSKEFTNMPDGRYYAWAMDRVGNVSTCKAFAFPQAIAVGTDGNTVDLLLWDFTDKGDTYSLDGYAGSIIDSKIVGSVPATINGKPVTVMSNTFKGCTGLIQAPELPNSVTNISGIFEGCTGLTQAPEIPNGVTNIESAFSGCKGLTQAPQIPAGVINMRYTFNNCTALTQAPVLPSTVTTINHTFSSCTALTQLPEIPAGVTDMNAAFSKCTKLTQTPQIPDSVIDMSYAFYMCTSLTQMPVIPNCVTDMKYTFSGCTKITGDIFIPKSVIRITSIFANTAMPITMIYSSNNTVAASVVVSSNVNKAVDSALPEISSVTEIDGAIIISATDNYSVERYAITTSNTAPSTGWQTSKEFANMTDGRYYAWVMDSVGNVSAGKAFMYPQAVSVDVAIDTDGNAVDLLLWNYTDNGDTYSLDTYTGSIVDGKILGSVPTTINGKPVTAMSNTFKGCTGLIQAPELPNSVTNISGIFEGCIGLTQAPQIPNGVTIMEYAFSGCKSLTQVPQLPASVTNIRYTFNNCTALTQAPVLPSSVTTINHAFSGCSALTQAPEIPNGVTDMNAAFSKCTKLTQTPQIPYSVIDMSYTFYMCTGLTQMPVIPNSVTDMKYTFSGCTSLTGNIFIPKSVIRISNIFTNTAMPITMIYSADNTTASSYTAPANVTKVIDTQDVTDIAVSVDDTTDDEAGGTATFTVNLSETFSSDITVYYVTSDNTATAGDYTSTSGILTIPAGSKTANITVPVTNDTDYEKSESFYLNLTNTSIGVITDNQGECTITDNDSLPAVNLSVSDSSFSEYGGTSTITATLSNKSYQDVTVNLHYAGTAINGTDYITSGSAIVIPAGSLSNSIILTAIDNTVNTGNRTVILSISGIENGVENGTQQQTLTIREKDTSLRSLSISSGSLTPAFAPTTLAYIAPKVPYETTSVTVSAIAVDPTSSIKVNGVAMTDGQSIINLNVGVNTIYVLVMASDGVTTKTYTITVEREQGAFLSNLTISSVTLNPTFSSGNLNYTTQNVGYDTASVKVTPTTNIPSCTITVNGNAATSGQPSPVNLAVGSNTINIVVTNGAASQTYTITVVRASNPYLSSVTGIPGITFVKTTYTYTINTTMRKLKNVGIVPEDSNADIAITMNGVTIPYSSSITFDLINGANVLIITDTSASGGDSRTYTFNINRTAAPTATVQPITGTLQTGATLTGHYTYSDVNGDLEGTSTYKWYRSDNAAGLNKNVIAGQTAITYVLTSADIGKYISFEVTPIAATGIALGTAVESARVGAIVPAEAAPTATVQAITGTLQLGETLSGNYTYSDVNGDLEGTSTFKWYRSDDAAGLNKTVIAGATSITYVLTSADIGKYISFEVTPIAATGIALGTAVESARVGAIVPEEAAPTATMQAITGTLQIGAALTGNYTYSDVNGDIEVASSFKWYRADDLSGLNKTEIAGATATTYVLISADLGKYISFEVTPVAATGIAQGTAVLSAWAGAVVPAEAAPTATVQAITGTLKVGEILTGHYIYSDVNGDLEGTSTFKWYRSDDAAGLNKTVIAGATSITYVLTSADEGKYIAFEVTPVAATGIAQGSAVESVKVGAVEKKSEQTSGSYSPIPITPTIDVFINDEKINYATSEIKLEDGKKKTTIKLDDEKLTIKLNKENEGSVITIPVNNNSDSVIGQLNGQTVKNMQDKNTTLKIKTENVIYTIPAEDINIDNVLKKIGSQVQLKDITVKIIVSNSSKETITKVENSAISSNLQLVVNPVDFEITCTNGSKTVDVYKFNNYVERTVILPEGTDGKKITTGVVLNEGGTFSHVPTAVELVEGKYHAKINSLTNSTYTVIWNPVTFNDVEKHWSKDYVNDVGSRLIDDGVGDGNFAPNRAITRAEFASMVVKALGLKGTNFPEKFGDVKKGDAYHYYIYTAYEYGILASYSNGNFGPQDLITREQAMIMLAKAMEIAGINVTVSDTDVSNQLKLFKDSDNISVYARQAVSTCIKYGIYDGGNEGRLTPKDNFTRAECATAIIKLLKKSELI